MQVFLEIALFALLILAFVQDRKSRSIHVLVFIGLGVASSILFYKTRFEWNVVLTNLLFVSIVMLGLFLYLSLKEGQFFNIFKTHFGLGDLLFFIVITPLFSNRNFIFFFITGLVFSGIVHLLLNAIKRSGETVPLAGYLAIYVMLLRIVDLCLSENLLYTDII